MKIVDEALLAHVMHNFARRVIHAILFVEFSLLTFLPALKRLEIFIIIIRAYCIELLVSFAEQLRINRHFFFKRFIFFDCEVITIKDVQNTISSITFYRLVLVGKQTIGQQNVRVYPVIVIHWVEKTTVKKGDFAVESTVIIIIVTTVISKSIIKQVFKHIVIKALITTMFLFKQFAQKVPRTFTPFRIPRNAKPALLL